ncbi:trypsin-like serine protease [Pedobacter sp. HMF7647]|uniref:Trypsin-like serine protease n=1 Tax=Hufsiella arboris TaxID=2695275 RepID=A0A7K1YDK0_9SPHI|nr:AVAST type 2 anti-phage system protein Avs2 [Hufsiella arboris]MXV52673.1 trypsin-like serine protease [Hufsiella arboris]
MLPYNDATLSLLTVRFRHANTLQPIGSGVIYYHPRLKDRVYILTAAHCLFADKDAFTQPLNAVKIDIYDPSANAYVEFDHAVDHELVSAHTDRDVAVLLLNKTVVEAVTGPLPTVAAVAERQSATTFVIKGFPNATQGRELDLIQPTWKQEMTAVRKFQLQLEESYSAWATAGFSGSGVFLHTHNHLYLFGLFARFREEEMGKVVYAQYLETVNEVLAAAYLPLISLTFFGQHGLNSAFFRQHVDTAIKNLGPRFNEKLNLQMPVSRLFNVIAKDERFRKSVLTSFDTYLSATDRSTYDEKNEIIKFVSETYRETRKQLKTWLDRADWHPGGVMDFEVPLQSLKMLNEIITDKKSELYQLQREKQKEEPRKERDYSYRAPFEGEIDRLYAIGSDNDNLIHGIESANFALTDAPFLLIKGEAGCGKSHLLGDIATARSKEGKPSLLLLGQLFKKEQGVWPNILSQLSLSCTKEELLFTLNDIGRQIGSRVLILIDALNEGDGKVIWSAEQAGFLEEIGNYPYIGVVLTVRSVYWNAVVPKTVQSDPKFTKITYEGFKGNEYAALRLFCAYYGLQQPNFPILAPEYANPLFLQLVCEGVKASPDKQFPQGFQGFSRLFGFYLQAVNEKLSAKREEYALRTKLAEEAIIELADASFAKSSRSLSLEAAVALFDERFPKHLNLLNDLIQENVFIQSLWHNYDTKADEDIVYFSYERFGDFFIARELLKDFETAEQLRASFQDGQRLGDLIADHYHANHGILEALAVILPEKFGLEIFEVYDWAFTSEDENIRWKASEWINHWLLGSLKWRTSQSIQDPKLADWFNSEQFTVDFDRFLNAMLELVPVVGHPYNGDRLQRFFMHKDMAERDSFLQQFLYYYQGYDEYKNPFPIRGLIEWAWQPGISARIDGETARLTGQCLAWALSSTHRKLRDQATKAIVNLLEEQPGALIAVLKAFEKVDDAYISERLYAVAYGCALRTGASNGLQRIAQHVFDVCFATGDPPPHLLLRDYARNIVEYALYKGVTIRGDIDRIRPPYHSPMPEIWPSEEDIAVYEMDYKAEGYREKYGHAYNRIHHSVMEWDFSRYTISHAFRDFSPFSFRVEEAKKQFMKALKPKKRDLVRLYIMLYEGLELVKQKEADGRIFTKLADDKTLREFYEEQLVAANQWMEIKLDEGERKHVLEQLTPHLDNKVRSKHHRRYAFDTQPVKRWIVKRAFSLGYTAELHGPYDSRVGDFNSRSENKIERIGKKYQWIALYEILAYTTDNYQLREGYGDDECYSFYQGPWQKYLRDVDPAFTTKNPAEDDEEEDPLGIVQPEQQWWTPEPYTYWDQPNADWAVNKLDLPDPKQIIARRDEFGQDWLYLHLNCYYKEPKPVGAEKYYRLKKDIWYGFQAYLVKKNTKSKILGWLDGQNFFGRWMPESHSHSGLFNRENYWSPASKYYQEEQRVWQRLDGSRHHVIVATVDAVGELADDKSGAHFSYQMPCQTIFEGMELAYAPQDGDFTNAARELVVTNANPRGVLVRKMELMAFLEKSGLELVWTLLGEKNVWGSNSKAEDIYQKVLSGVYTLDAQGAVTGDFHLMDRR